MKQKVLGRWVRRASALAVVVCVLESGAVVLGQAPPSPPQGQSEFVPISELPPSEQLPAAPLLIAAYAFVWVALLAYLWSIWRRLGKVERELATLGNSAPGNQSRRTS